MNENTDFLNKRKNIEKNLESGPKKHVFRVPTTETSLYKEMTNLVGRQNSVTFQENKNHNLLLEKNSNSDSKSDILSHSYLEEIEALKAMKKLEDSEENTSVDQKLDYFKRNYNKNTFQSPTEKKKNLLSFKINRNRLKVLQVLNDNAFIQPKSSKDGDLKVKVKLLEQEISGFYKKALVEQKTLREQIEKERIKRIAAEKKLEKQNTEIKKLTNLLKNRVESDPDDQNNLLQEEVFVLESKLSSVTRQLVYNQKKLAIFKKVLAKNQDNLKKKTSSLETLFFWLKICMKNISDLASIVQTNEIYIGNFALKFQPINPKIKEKQSNTVTENLRMKEKSFDIQEILFNLNRAMEKQNKIMENSKDYAIDFKEIINELHSFTDKFDGVVLTDRVNKKIQNLNTLIFKLLDLNKKQKYKLDEIEIFEEKLKKWKKERNEVDDKFVVPTQKPVPNLDETAVGGMNLGPDTMDLATSVNRDINFLRGLFKNKHNLM